MVGWFHELPLAVLLGQIFLAGLCCLIVGHIEFWFVALPLEVSKDFIKSFQNSIVFQILDWNCVDIVAVIIVGDEEILVAI